MDNNNKILIISDMHIPYQHVDVVKFLTAVKKKYRPTRIVCVGDEVDKHAMSFHDSDPDLPSAGDELRLAIKELQPIYELFPKVTLVDSNHGSMHYRKGKHHGIPRKYLRDYGDILEAPNGWTWVPELRLKSGNVDVLIRHQFSKNILRSAQFESCCLVAGHFHEDYCIQYASNHDKLLWGMTVGCLINDKTLAFEYNNTNMKRPIIGVGMIINGTPSLIPMVLNKRGRWIGELK